MGLLANGAVHWYAFSLLPLKKKKHRIVLQGEKWLKPKWRSAWLFIGQVNEKDMETLYISHTLVKFWATKVAH